MYLLLISKMILICATVRKLLHRILGHCIIKSVHKCGHSHTYSYIMYTCSSCHLMSNFLLIMLTLSKGNDFSLLYTKQRYIKFKMAKTIKHTYNATATTNVLIENKTILKLIYC